MKCCLIGLMLLVSEYLGLEGDFNECFIGFQEGAYIFETFITGRRLKCRF